MVRSKIRRAARRCGGIHNYFDFILVAGILLILGTFEAGLLRDSLSVETVQRPGLCKGCSRFFWRSITDWRWEKAWSRS